MRRGHEVDGCTTDRYADSGRETQQLHSSLHSHSLLYSSQLTQYTNTPSDWAHPTKEGAGPGCIASPPPTVRCVAGRGEMDAGSVRSRQAASAPRPASCTGPRWDQTPKPLGFKVPRDKDAEGVKPPRLPGRHKSKKASASQRVLRYKGTPPRCVLTCRRRGASTARCCS